MRNLLCRCGQWPHLGIFLIVFISSVVNLLMIFVGSDYGSYLTSDMHGYWERAQQIFSGDEMTPNTWVSNAPFYSRVIAAIFTWASYFHLNNYFLEILLIINVLTSALGNIALYYIGLHSTGSKKAALWLAGLYAFAYPSLYFNVFLLGEPFAVPLIICAIALTFYWRDSNKIFLAGGLLAFAVAVRPSNGLIGLPCALYILFSGLSPKQIFHMSISWSGWRAFFPRILRAGLFTMAFGLVIFGVIAENNRISKGELRGITAHSGYNFFLGQTEAHKIESHWDGLGYGFVPSSVAGNPEFGTVRMSIPIYKSDEYFAEGFKVLQQHPELWIEHLGKFRFLFFDNLFPGVPGVAGFIPMMDIYRYVVFYMLLFAIGGVVIAVREKDVNFSYVAVFSSIFLLCGSSLYLFTVTHQYFTNFSYTVYVLFVFTALAVIRHFRKYRKYILGYLAVLLVLVVYHYGGHVIERKLVSPKVEVTLEQLSQPIFNVNAQKDVASTETIYVDSLNFIPRIPLTHADLGRYGDYEYNFFMTARARMVVKNAGTYMFQIYSDDGYEMFIDGRKMMGAPGLKKMDEFQIRRDIRLTEGEHEIEIRMFQNGVFAGLVGYYRRIDNVVPYAPYEFDTKKGKGNYIGIDSENVTFQRFED